MTSFFRLSFKWVTGAFLACCLAFSCTDDDQQTPASTDKVTVSDFSAAREDNHIGGKLYMPGGKKGPLPAVILCHGLFGSHKDLSVYAMAAAEMGSAAVCFDFCGGPVGESLSDGSAQENSISTESADLKAVYDALVARSDIDPDRIIVMGASQGGLIASYFAAENPEKVKALGLFYPAFNLPDLVRAAFDLLYDGDTGKLPDPVVLLPDILPDVKFSKKYVMEASALYPFEFIGYYKGPVNIIHGDADIVVPLETSREALKKYTDADLIVLKGQPHVFDEDGKKEALEHVKAWFGKVL